MDGDRFPFRFVIRLTRRLRGRQRILARWAAAVCVCTSHTNAVAQPYWPEPIMGPPFDAPVPVASPLQQMQDAVTRLVQRVSPSVVAVHTDAAASGDPVDDERRGVLGTGIVLRADGAILTNQHVIQDAETILVDLCDGRSLRATVVGADARADLAVLRIETDGLIPLDWADPDGLAPGRLVFAFGHPVWAPAAGAPAVCQGIVSAVGRPLPRHVGAADDRHYGAMIQAAMAVGPGYSGGPMVDLDGRLVGILSVAQSSGAGPAALAFARPLDAPTRARIAQLLRGESIEYAYLGVETALPTSRQRDAAFLGPNEGVFIDAILPDGPAGRAGLRPGDIVLSVGGCTVESPDAFVQAVSGATPGRPMRIEFVRDGARDAAIIEPIHRPAPTTWTIPEDGVGFRGAQLAALSDDLCRSSNLPAGALLVVLVETESPADRAGLAPGDVVVRLDGAVLGPGVSNEIVARRGDVLLGLATGGSVLVVDK